METKPDFPKGFLERIEEFAEEYIQKYPVYKIREGGKVIHDSLWGTSHLSSFEIAILDLPLIQRLRQIRQTGLSYLIFPSTTHTRFEHTLGVMFQCRKLLDSLGKIQEFEDLLNKDIQLKVRTAALLHDCGHGPFSHSSEEIYEYFDDMQEVIGPGGILEGMHPHEVLAYCIVRTSALKRRLEEFVTTYKQPPIDLGEVADMIIGKANITNKYIVDMINGPFDADKLDYIFRDGHFSGLPLNIDLDRLWYSTQILPITEKNIRSLVTNLSGTTPLEQILFSKMVLYSAVYHHHKVRACDCMLKAILEHCQKNDEEISGRRIRNPTDFLWLTDDVIFSEADSQKRGKDDQIHKLIHNIKYRRLFKRALVISRATVEKESTDFFDYDSIKKLSLDLKECDNNLRKLAGEICTTAGSPCDELYVWVDLPKLPPIGSADDTYINEGTISKPYFEKLKKLFPVDDWAQDYAEHKWKGYVFCPNEEETRKKIAKAAKEVLEKKFNIKFNPLSIELSHPE